MFHEMIIILSLLIIIIAAAGITKFIIDEYKMYKIIKDGNIKVKDVPNMPQKYFNHTINQLLFEARQDLKEIQETLKELKTKL